MIPGSPLQTASRLTKDGKTFYDPARGSDIVIMADHPNNRHNWGIDAVAVDPQNDNMVYAAVGGYTVDTV